LFFRAEDGIRDRNVTGVQTCALPISPSNDCKFQIQNCGAGVRATTNECGSARVRAKALDREYVLALLEYGGSLIVFVKSDREPRILETASDFGAKSAPEPRTLEIVSDSGAKSDPESRICETVSDSGAKSDPESRICETVSDSGAKSDSNCKPLKLCPIPALNQTQNHEPLKLCPIPVLNKIQKRKTWDEYLISTQKKTHKRKNRMKCLVLFYPLSNVFTYISL